MKPETEETIELLIFAALIATQIAFFGIWIFAMMQGNFRVTLDFNSYGEAWIEGVAMVGIILLACYVLNKKLRRL